MIIIGKNGYPTGLKAQGKAIWDVLTSLEYVQEGDLYAIYTICKKVEELTRMETYLKKEGDLIGINHSKETGEPTNWILHPYRKQILEEEKTIFQLLNILGSSPKARIELGILGEKKETKIDNLLSEIDSFRKDKNE